jgi:hypothetical protein
MSDDLTHRIAVQVHEDFKQRLVANSPHFDGVLDDLPNLFPEAEINVAHTLRAIEAIGYVVAPASGGLSDTQSGEVQDFTQHGTYAGFELIDDEVGAAPVDRTGDEKP